mgnify:CR=1 FL=1
MKRPWQIWLVYLLCLALALPALGWLSWRAVQLDAAGDAARNSAEQARQQEAAARRAAELSRREAVRAAGLAEFARQQADLQERISSALWRMDWALTPLIAQEAARPYFVYRPFYEGPVDKLQGDSRPLPSPLLTQPSPYVLLYFQLRPGDEWTSPQRPLGAQCETALACGVRPEQIDVSAARLRDIESRVGYSDLLAMLPEQPLTIPVNDLVWATQFDRPNEPESQNANLEAGQQQQPYVVTNNLPYLPQQVEDGSQQQASAQPTASLDQQQPNAQPSQQPPAPGRNNEGPPRGNEPPQQVRGVPQQELSPQQLAEAQATRGGYEYWQRNRALQSYAQGKVVEQRFMHPGEGTGLPLVTEGVSRPLWVGDDLLLARRVRVQDQAVIQGAWLNWPRLEELLRAEVADLLPEVKLVPVRGEEPMPSGRSLATVPVRLEVPEPVLAETGFPTLPPLNTTSTVEPISPLRLTLPFAWAGLLLAAVAVAVLLRGVMSLSERRGAFVSAVTHELRTPLTTFRMYAEMLAEDMIPQGASRKQYLETLRVEADRLYHLVENVLAYARLERGSPGSRRRPTQLGEMLEGVRGRLEARAREAGMELRIVGLETVGDTLAHTDSAAVEQILFNLVDNACKYARPSGDSVIEMELLAEPRPAVRVRDRGPGIDAETRRKLFRPFSKSVHQAACSAPGVGLGLALCRRLAQQLGGDLWLEPTTPGCSFLLTLPRG